jgi:predicted PurR-regulated permease PerM
VELHPLAALFGVLAGAEIGGVIGVYLAVPLIAALRILWKRWTTYSREDLDETKEATEVSQKAA